MKKNKMKFGTLLVVMLSMVFMSVLSADTVGIWKFDDAAGSTAADSSGNSNNGTISGASWATDGKISGALSFDGTNDYVDIEDADSLDITGNQITIEAWIYPDALSENYIVSKFGGDATTSGYNLLVTNTQVFFRLGDGTTKYEFAPIYEMSTGVWHHIVAVYDGAKMQIYINGTKLSSCAYFSGNIGANSNNVNIGQRLDNNNQWDGYIDNVKIHDTALSATEILAAYNNGSLKGHWKFDDATGSTATDSSGNSNDGTISGTFWETDGKIGGTLSFDGTNDYVDVEDADSLDITGNQITIEAWVYPDALSENYIVSKFGSDATTSGYNLLVTAGYIYFRLGDGTTKYEFTPAHGMSTGVWYHIVAVYDGATMKVYKNGTALSGSTSFTGNIGTNSNNVNIGQRLGGSYQWDGYIDNVKIHNRAISTAEIIAGYNAGSLKGHWKFDEYKGTTTADFSINNNIGTISGASWTDGKIDNALSFNGTSDYIDVEDADSLDITGNQITIEAWIYPETLSENYIVSKFGSDATTSGYNLLVTAGYIYFRLGDGTTRYEFTPAHGMSTYTWYHIVAVYDGATMKVYKNGTALSGSTSFTGNIGTNSNNVNIGQRLGGSYKWNGCIDDVKIYNRALSAAEIATGYNASLYPWDNLSGDPIGGGGGYSDILTTGDVTVSTASGLLTALDEASSGDVIYVTDSAVIDLTDEITTTTSIIIPAGVTLASGRGNNGSQGALLYMVHHEETVNRNTETKYVLFKAGGAGVRITGLRISGNETTREGSYSDYNGYTNSTTYGIYSSYSLEVDNCEIYGFSHSAVRIDSSVNGSVSNIHHNYIHHNLRRGLGYGVGCSFPQGGNVNTLVEGNLFNYNRHSITTFDGVYHVNMEICYNLQPGNDYGTTFDVHGTLGGNWNGGDAGDTILIYGNTVYGTPGAFNIAVGVRGVPTNTCDVYDNHFHFDDEPSAIVQLDENGDGVDGSYINMTVEDNYYSGKEL